MSISSAPHTLWSPATFEVANASNLCALFALYSLAPFELDTGAVSMSPSGLLLGLLLERGPFWTPLSLGPRIISHAENSSLGSLLVISRWVNCGPILALVLLESKRMLSFCVVVAMGTVLVP